jgi:hypothetical protein
MSALFKVPTRYCNFDARECGAPYLFHPGQPRHSREANDGAVKRIRQRKSDAGIVAGLRFVILGYRFGFTASIVAATR